MSPTPGQRKFTLNLLTEWRRLGLPMESGKVILAVSGGADSCALAAAVADLRRRGKLSCEIIAAHFDHGLRGDESEEDARFVERLASDLGFGFELGKAPKSLAASASNLEEKARNARYAFLSKLARSRAVSHVLTAHTINDQAETLLMNLIRGAGLSGLSGMDPVRPFEEVPPSGGAESKGEAQAVLCRPLLAWATREDTEGYVRDCGIVPREDAMNRDPAFKRVRVRRDVIPVLKELNPSIVRTLASVAETLNLEKDLIHGDPAVIAAVAELASSEKIRVSELLELPFSARVITVRQWLGRRRASLRNIDLKHCKAVVSLAGSGKSGQVVEIPRFGRVVKRAGRLSYEVVKVEK